MDISINSYRLIISTKLFVLHKYGKGWLFLTKGLHWNPSSQWWLSQVILSWKNDQTLPVFETATPRSWSELFTSVLLSRGVACSYLGNVWWSLFWQNTWLCHYLWSSSTKWNLSEKIVHLSRSVSLEDMNSPTWIYSHSYSLLYVYENSAPQNEMLQP